MIRYAIFLTLGLAVPQLSIAQDGAIEINQACISEGCFDGDDPGFPVEITASGVYRLTGNLTVPEDVHGIEVGEDLASVLIDLNGFAVIGPNSCTGEPVTTCTTNTPMDGIRLGDQKVINGTVSGFEVGVRCTGCELDGLKLSHNSEYGVSAYGLTARNCTFERNGSVGVLAGEGEWLVEGSIMRFNFARGFFDVGDADGVFRNNVVGSNDFGSSFSDRMLITGNSFDQAFNDGVTAGDNVCDTTSC